MPRAPRHVLSLRLPLSAARVLPFALAASVVMGPSAALAAAVVDQAVGEDAWTVVGGDPAHSGTAPGGPPPPYRRAWTAEVTGGPVAGPVVADGKAVVVGGTSVAALDMATGDVVWQAVRSPGPAGSAAIAGGLVVHASGEGFAASLVARDLDDGRERWRLRTGAASVGGLTADAERVYAGTRSGFALAVDLEDGQEVWRYRAPGRVETSPALADGRLIVAAENPRSGEAAAIALEAETGRRAWKFSPEGPDIGASSPAVAGDTVFLGLGQRVHALGLATGRERWSASVLATAVGSRAFIRAQVPAAPDDLVGVDLLHVHRIDGTTGEERWTFRIVDGLFQASPAISDGAVIVGDQAGGLSAISLEEGVRVWRTDLGEGAVPSVAIALDRVIAVVKGRDGRVVALENDPDGSLAREPSASELFVGRSLLNFVVAAAAVGVAVFGLFRWLLPLRAAPEEGS